jgi:hypothetical protein
MHIENTELGVSFDLPEVFTVRLRLAYNSCKGFITSSDQIYEKLWDGAKALITNWQSEDVKLDDSLDTLTTAKQAKIVEWAGLKVSAWIRDIDRIPKNS